MCVPQSSLTGFVPERLEWNSYLYCVAVRTDRSLGLHHDVETVVFAAAFGKNPICLHAKSAEEERVRFAAIVECVDEHSDVIVIPYAVSLAQRSPDFVRLVVRNKSKIERALVVSDQ